MSAENPTIVPIRKSAGRIWRSKPTVTSDGLLSVFIFPPATSTIPQQSFLLTSFAGSYGSRPRFSATDSRGSVWSFNPAGNEFKRIATSGGGGSGGVGVGTALCYKGGGR